MMKNIKDIFTTIAGILGAISAAIIGIAGVLTQYAISVPVWLIVMGACCGVVSVVLIGFFQGKNADGTKKTKSQLQKQAIEKLGKIEE